MSSHLVLVDNTNSNSSIQYSGPWFEVQNTQINTGPFWKHLTRRHCQCKLFFPFSGMSRLVYCRALCSIIRSIQKPQLRDLNFDLNFLIGKLEHGDSDEALSYRSWGLSCAPSWGRVGELWTTLLFSGSAVLVYRTSITRNALEVFYQH